MDNKISNISFTSKIKFIPHWEYKLRTKYLNPVKIGEITDIKEVKKFDKRGATEKIIVCIGGVIQDLRSKRKRLFHWLPVGIVEDSQPSRENSKKITTTLQKTPKHHKLKGFIIGGYAKSDKWLHEFSVKIFNTLKRSLKHVEDKDFTIFFAQREPRKINIYREKPQTAFIYSNISDTYYVNCRKIKNMGLKNPQDQDFQDLLSKEEIYDYFDYIKLSPNDRVYARGRKTPNSFWDKTNTHN